MPRMLARCASQSIATRSQQLGGSPILLFAADNPMVSPGRKTVLASWLSLTLLLILAAPAIAEFKLSNGAVCKTGNDCNSGACKPYPDAHNYCLARDMDCAEPESDGLPPGYTAKVDGRTWMCRNGSSWQLSEKRANGDRCNGDSQCASDRCRANPDGHRYCLARPLDCADSHTNGVRSGFTMQFEQKSWSCLRGTGWGAARFSEFDNGVGRHRVCSPLQCPSGDADCQARQKAKSQDCEQLKAIEIELATPVSLAIAQGRDAAVRAGVYPIPKNIRIQLQEFFTANILNEVRYRVGSAGDSELLRFAFDWLRTSAFVMGHVIIFRSEQDALNDVRLWAHELEHVIQYEYLGIDGFAQRWIQAATRGEYDEDRTTIEGAATARAIYVCSHISC